jgi:hypothetical protein
MVLPGPGADDTTPVDEVVGTFDGGVTDVEQDADGSLWVVTPTALYEQTGPIQATSPSPSVRPGEEEPGSGLVTVGGLLIAGVLIGGLLLMRSRLLRR